MSNNENTGAHRKDLFRHVTSILRFGACEEELTEALASCISRSQATGKASELTLKIKIKPKGASGQYFVEDDIKTKLPAPMKDETILFGTPDGNLVREDPRQMKMELRGVKEEAPAMREVDTARPAMKAI